MSTNKYFKKSSGEKNLHCGIVVKSRGILSQKALGPAYWLGPWACHGIYL